MDLKKILPRNLRESIMFGLSFLPDEPYIRLFYYATTGRKLNLINPTTFEDKQQWLKLHHRNEGYGKLVDKLAVREHIEQEIGEDYLIPLLGQWEKASDLDFLTLPDSFVLKCNHDSGSVKIIKDKSKLTEEDKRELIKYFEKKLKRNFYYAGREYPYKRIKPCLLAEKYMIDKKQELSSLNDYKFFCFHGVPKIVLIVTDRAVDCRYDFYDMDFNHLDLKYGKQRDDGCIKKPEFFDEMKRIATKLSKDIPFVRIDLYEVNGHVYFGEYTFFDGGGFQYLQPEKWEYRMGSWIHLMNDRKVT